MRQRTWRPALAAGLGTVILLFAAISVGAPSRTHGPAWLGGDTVEVAPHRIGLMGSHSSKPLLGYLAKLEAPGRHPAVVVLHGCNGFGMGPVVAADVLKSFGYVALALASLDGTNLCGGADADAAEAIDAYAALDWLVRQNFADPDRVAVLGFSMGGIATLDAVEAGVGAIEKAEKRHFRAAVAFYPYCRYRAGVMTVPTLILAGGKDDWAPASYCREMMTRRAGKGAPVKLVVYPGAMHGFNFPFTPHQILGHHQAYDPEATADAWRRVRAFLQTTLGGPQPAGNASPSSAAAQNR